MENLAQKIREQIAESVKKAIIKSKELGEMDIDEIPEIALEKPKEKVHGDYATTVAMVLTKKLKKNPRLIAETIVKNMDISGTYIESVEIAGPGYINFRLKREWLYDLLKIIEREKEDYGKSDIGKGVKIQVEFVSANPTGPMHIGNARGGALGDVLASLLSAAGYEVEREFYINDAGNQVEKLGQSLEARYLELLGIPSEIPEGGYHGEDIIEYAKEFVEKDGDKYLDYPPSERQKIFTEYVLQKNIQKLKDDLKAYNIEYDVWFSERSLYESGEIYETIELLKKSGYTYEKDGALWFKATEFGVEKDEVLVRSNGIPTYFASDIAYHRNKFEKRGFDIVIDIWGADHHGHVPRLKGAMKALGIDPERLQVILMQLVRLFRNGEVVRMSKRTGKVITLRDLIDEVGTDAARFFFNLRSYDSHLDFDLDLAVQESNENPVFYVQYAHARICSILRNLAMEGVELKEIGDIDLSVLKEEEELDLIRKLSEYPDEIIQAAKKYEPHRITRYVLDLASLFHTFYNSCRVKNEDRNLMMARLVLVDCVRIVIKNVLDLMKISAPEKM